MQHANIEDSCRASYFASGQYPRALGVSPGSVFYEPANLRFAEHETLHRDAFTTGVLALAS